MEDLEKLEREIRNAIIERTSTSHFELLIQLEIAKQLSYILSELNCIRNKMNDK